MTLCAYIHPNGYPTILSDLLVTNDDKKLRLDPSNLTTVNFGDYKGIALLMRKVFHLKEQNSIFAMAGEVQAIMDFREYFPLQYKERMIPGRPMRTAGDIANDFNSDTGRLAISLTGLSRIDEERIYNVKILAGAVPTKFKTKNFNECFSDGSGAHEGANLISYVDQLIRPEKTPSIAALSLMLGIINSIKIFSKTEDVNKDSWGGYIENTTMIRDGELLPRLSWSHLCYFVDAVAGRRSAALGPKQVHYNPSGIFPAVGLLTRNEHGGTSVVQLPIRDSFDFSPIPNLNLDHWLDFIPDRVTVCFFHQDGRKMYRTFSPQHDGFLVRNGLLDFSLEQEFLDRCFEESFL